MKFAVGPSHVAILVPSVRKAADYLRQFKFEIGEVEEFEETREIYINGADRNSLLLMEPKGPGSYQRALEKRGPGLHHLAIDVLNVDEALASLSGSGWLLHLNSLKSLKGRCAYLARPGFPGLIEVQEKKKFSEGPLLVKKMDLQFDSKLQGLIKAIGLDEIVSPTKGESTLVVGKQTIKIADLF